ncbi:hypothetical protein DW895_01720 [Firmicutes bacterium AM41-11]|nr:hypothetical protein DW895_01720 [Firmicutes bacterium AM41-11]
MNFIEKLKMKDNTGIIYRNTVYAGLVKFFSLFIALFTTPAYMHYFNNDEILGVWFTILSVLAWILNCDMGIGNGLRNNLVYAINEKNWDKAKKYISSAYYFLSVLGIVILLIIVGLGNLISWNVVFNISSKIISTRIMKITTLIVLASIVLQFVLRLVTSILYALQEAFIPGLLNLATNLILLLYVLIANYIGENNNIVFLALMYLFAANIPLLIATIWVFSKKLPNSRPSIFYYKKEYAFSILKIGVAFLWLQLISMVVDNTNNYLITLFVGNAAVVEFQIYYKIFSLPTTVVMLLTTSLWSTITKAKAEGDWKWIASSYKKFIKISLIFTLMEFLMIIPLQLIFNIWLGDKTITVNYGIACIFAVSGSIMSLRTILANYSNGLYEIRIQGIYMTFGAIINIPLAYILSCLFDSYISIVIANVISMLPYCMAQMIWCKRNILNKVIV